MTGLSLTRPSHWVRLAVVLAAFFVALVGLAGESSRSERDFESEHAHSSFADSASDEESPLVSALNAETRLREGSQIVQQLGVFHDTGDRIIFQPRGAKIEFPTLENLALERIARVLDESHTPRLWSVSGNLTEFKGGNYLFVTRAVLKAKVGPQPEAFARTRGE
jgi:hypothetical protein